MSSTHHLQRGLHGYLIRIATHAFALVASGLYQQTAFAIGVLADINAFYYYTGNSICLFYPLAQKYFWQF